MKIRSGFVSNSSSSSFVVIAPKTVVDQVLKSLTPYERAVAKHVKVSDKEFMGQKVSIFQGMTGNADSWEYAFEYDGKVPPSKEEGYGPLEPGEEPEEMGTYEAWDNFVKTLRKTAGADIIISESDY